MNLERLRVAFYVHPTAFQNYGGAEVQLLKTKKYLEHLGVEVSLFDSWNDKIEAFDLLHTFGSIKDSLPMMRIAKHRKVVNVLSTICFHSLLLACFSERGWKRRATNIVRHLAKECIPMIPSQRKEMMDLSQLLLPNSEIEAAQLTRFFCQDRSKIRVIPNAVENIYARATPELFISRYNLRDFVLCVGRIEPRKNQLNIIRALKNFSVPIVFIGSPVLGYEDYFRKCQKEATANFHFLGDLKVDSELLQSAYAACGVFILASWCETPGLAALEAGLAGVNIVVTAEGATKEYFLDQAAYISPLRVGQIREKVLEKLNQPKTSKLKEHISEHYTWERAAALTLSAYREVLSLRDNPLSNPIS